ncbi:GTPase IMAP family member 7-like [Sardina pilchardus]|uniref:GTPase IMAP family member 7-like n=1 Tax=Sardina pilchardus TaxID=27697 RepID=UPI002E14C6C5
MAVLLGCRAAGKSSSANTILGRQECDLRSSTAQCVKRQGEVAGRQLTVVEAPGWWSNVSLKSTPEPTKQRILHSVGVCSPGPHVLLIHIPVQVTFTEDIMRNLQEHLELLGEGVWRHTVVLFTYGGWLGGAPIEQHIEIEGCLKHLVEKCGNRYHVIDNENKGDQRQISELMERLEETITENEGGHYTIAMETLMAAEIRAASVLSQLQEISEKIRNMLSQVMETIPAGSDSPADQHVLQELDRVRGLLHTEAQETDTELSRETGMFRNRIQF